MSWAGAAAFGVALSFGVCAWWYFTGDLDGAGLLVVGVLGAIFPTLLARFDIKERARRSRGNRSRQ